MAGRGLRPTVVMATMVVLTFASRGAVVAGAASEPIPCGDVAGLVAAIENANQNPSPSTVELGQDCAYTLSTAAAGADGLPVITSPVTIDGNGSSIVRSDAAGTADFRLLEVAKGGTLNLDEVHVRGGSSTEGGGILNAGTLHVEQGSVEHNTVSDTDEADGGGISNHGTATITDSSIADNTTTSASSVAQGGGILTWDNSTLTVERTAIKGNRAVTTSDSAVGGGLVTMVDSRTTVEHSGIDGNSVASSGSQAIGGALADGGTVTIDDSTLDDNLAVAPGGEGFGRGGAISDTGNLQVTGSKVSGNRVTGALGVEGGGIYTGGGVKLSSTDVTNNRVENTQSGFNARGGGLFAAGETTTIDGGTISANQAAGPTPSGGGIYASMGSRVDLHGTSVGGNSPNQCRPLGSVPNCHD